MSGQVEAKRQSKQSEILQSLDELKTTVYKFERFRNEVCGIDDEPKDEKVSEVSIPSLSTFLQELPGQINLISNRVADAHSQIREALY